VITFSINLANILHVPRTVCTSAIGTWKKWRPDLWMSAFVAGAGINQLGHQGLLTARLTHWRSSRRRSLVPTDTRRSPLSTATPAHAPFPTPAAGTRSGVGRVDFCRSVSQLAQSSVPKSGRRYAGGIVHTILSRRIRLRCSGISNGWLCGVKNLTLDTPPGADLRD